MQKIFSDFLVGRSTEQIAADLRVNNIPCKNGRAQWDSSSVRYILRNEKYTGNSKWQKYYTPSTFPFHCKINAGEAQCYSSIPESRRCLLHGQHPSACPLTHPETPWYIFQNHVHVPPVLRHLQAQALPRIPAQAQRPFANAPLPSPDVPANFQILRSTPSPPPPLPASSIL